MRWRRIRNPDEELEPRRDILPRIPLISLQQAYSLEETAAALDQITVNVASSSKRAQEAQNLMQAGITSLWLLPAFLALLAIVIVQRFAIEN